MNAARAAEGVEMHTKRGVSMGWLALALAALFAGSAFALGKGDVAPGFKLARLDGAGEVKLGDLRGKVVFVDFWASWCAPCQKSMPQFDALAKEFPADRFALIGVNVDSDTAAAKKVLSKRPVSYTIVSDPSGTLPGRYGVETMPMAYLLDGDGAIRYVHRGFRDGDIEKLREHIQKLLAEKR
jgi:cytochrome c biogenesis protein CcmG, thiol:disulfide interchange protein DsbE